MKKTLDFYSKIYDPLFKKSNYTRSTHRGGVSLDVFEKFSKANKVKIKTALDVGCAWGKTLKYWKLNNVEGYGVDVSPFIIRKCKKKGFNYVYISSATDLSIFPDKKFDLYMASDVYEHLRTEDLKDAIEEAKRVTKKYLLIRPHPVMDKRGRADKSKALHLTVWCLERWESFFKQNGLQIMKVGENGESWHKNSFLLKIPNGDIYE